RPDAGSDASLADSAAASPSAFCPNPRDAATGGACDVTSTTPCRTTKVIAPCDASFHLQSCLCASGRWTCDDEPPCLWPGPCPQPSDLQADAACTTGDAGESALSDCPGPPHLCGTDIITSDDYACVGGRWTVTARLICSDAGF